MRKYLIPKKELLTALITSSVFVVITFLSFSFYLRQISIDITKGWIETESNVLIYNSIYTSTARMQKYLNSSNLLTGISVFTKSGHEVEELVKYGQIITPKVKNFPKKEKEILINYYGILNYQTIVYPDSSRSIYVVFGFNPTNIFNLFLITLFLNILFLILTLLLLSRLKNRIFKESISSLQKSLTQFNINSDNISPESVSSDLKDLYKFYISFVVEKEKTKEKSKLALQIAHDLRSPIAAIKSITSSLKSNDGQELSILTSSLDRLENIANDVLREKKDQPKPIRIGSLYNIINNIFLEKRQTSPNVNFILNAEAKEHKDSQVNFSVNDFERIISNLFNNSIEAQSSNITISSEINDQHFVLKIHDNGNGIPTDVLQDFSNENFYSHNKKEGNGLGMSHCAQIVSNCNGTFNIESEVNSYTQITISLPIIKDNEKIVLTIPTNLGTPKIIHLDNDKFLNMAWEIEAKEKDLEIFSYLEFKDLLIDLEKFSSNDFFFIDHDLGENSPKGIDVLKELHSKGFLNLYLSTGHEKEHFPNNHYISGIIGKDFKDAYTVLL